MMTNDVNDSWNEVSGLCSSLGKNMAVAIDALAEGVVIFGAGAQGRFAINYLKKKGVKILCLADNNPDKQGTLLDDIPVVPPHDSSVTSAPIVLVAVRQTLVPLFRQLDELGIISMSFDAFFVISNMDHISYVRNNLLSDDRSRLSYDGILKTILIGDNSYCASVMEGNQYFALPEFVNIGNDHFVDAGAYVGDTVEKFIWSNTGIFKQIYAFEPGETQLAAMKHRVDRLCREWAIPKSAIICENAGLADNNKSLPLHKSNLLVNLSIDYDCIGDDRQGESINCYSLDSYLAGRPATFIKADIEGMELAMLHGAKETIRQYKPKMALSIYHNPAHLFEVPVYVNSLVPEYCMAVRHHSPIFAESVLYCWVP
jgi:FkbM family methyltransferase